MVPGPTHPTLTDSDQVTADPVPPLLLSARRATAWARALETGLERHGPTPTYAAVVDELGIDPVVTRRG